jgi:antitoxin (DNA-binding transcriptional repressor) of toxin-antitoxin stability system
VRLQPTQHAAAREGSALVAEAEVAAKCDWSYNVAMKQIPAGKFKEQCLAVLDHLDSEGVVVTKHGKPVAKVLPIEVESAALIGSMKGKITIKGDILSTGLKWDAQS